MNSSLQRTSWESTASHLDDAMRWLDGLGIRTNATRIAQYRKEAHAMALAAKKNTTGSKLTASTFSERCLLAYEIQQIIRIHQAFSRNSPSGLVERLEIFVKGPIAATDERPDSSSNRPRNIGFELDLGAKISLAGLPVEFPPGADIVASLGGKQLLVECKRPQNFDTVSGAISTALKQLKGRYKPSIHKFGKQRGIIAIALGKALMAKQHGEITNSEDTQKPAGQSAATSPRLEQHILPVVSADKITNKTDQELSVFRRDHEHEWADSRHCCTIGVLAHVDFISIIESGPSSLITYSADTVVTNIQSARQSDRDLLATLVDQMHRANYS